MSQLAIPDLLRQAMQYHEAGQLVQAEKLYRQILQTQPQHSDALHLLGVIAQQVGKLEVSLTIIAQAINANPFMGVYYNTYGEGLRRLGRLQEAIGFYQQAISRQPTLAEPWSNMGLALEDLGQRDQAEAAYRKAIELNPNLADAYNNLGTNLAAQKRFDESLAAHRRAIEIHPRYAIAWNNYGVTLESMGQLEEAIQAYQQAIALNPNLLETYHNIGVPFIKLNRIADAKAAWERALALRPDYADTHFNLSLALLLEGNFDRGWAEHEWRWRCPGLPQPRNFPQPQWDGSPLHGRVILLHAEQGFGDTLQFIRFAPAVAARGGRVILECQPEVLDLARSVAGVAEVIPTGATLPPFEVQIPLLSLPFALRTTLADIPHQVPYLTVPPQAAARWKDRLAALPAARSRQLKVGLIWQGRDTHKDDKNRSMHLADFAALNTVENAVFFSLQKGPAAAQAKHPPAGLDLIDLTDEFQDFSDTAALISHLDLVIGVDTSVVHLAGALARPVWTLLPFAPDWRWLMERVDTPWYPTMRLFRQPTRGHWAPLVADVARALQTLASTKEVS